MKAETLKIDQKEYIQDLLEAEGMTLCHVTILFMKTGLFISMNQVDNYNSANLEVYQRFLEKLIYLVYGTQLDISFIVGLLSRYNSDPRVEHFCVTKQMLRYLKELINLGIVWRSDPTEYQDKYNLIGIVGYADSSYTRDPEDRKLITGYSFFLSVGIVT